MVKWFNRLEGFANRDKNWLKHSVTFRECEEGFADKNKKLFSDRKHSVKEKRYLLFAVTERQRYILIAFTIRNSYVRVVSARDMSKKERTIYEQAVKNSKI